MPNSLSKTLIVKKRKKIFVWGSVFEKVSHIFRNEIKQWLPSVKTVERNSIQKLRFGKTPLSKYMYELILYSFLHARGSLHVFLRNSSEKLKIDCCGKHIWICVRAVGFWLRIVSTHAHGGYLSASALTQSFSQVLLLFKHFVKLFLHSTSLRSASLVRKRDPNTRLPPAAKWTPPTASIR